MKIRIKSFTAFLIATLMCFFAVGCTAVEPQDGTQVLFDLQPPKITVAADGTASWQKVDGAIYYIYVVNDGQEQLTTERSVKLNDNDVIKVKAVSGLESMGDSAFCAPITYKKGVVVTPVKLATPQVTVSASGLAEWGAVTDAARYAYVINGGAEQTTSARSVQLADGDTFKVKAIGDGANYTDSDFSAVKTYKRGIVVTPVKLATPQVTVSASGLAEWGAVTDAARYAYVINGGAEQTTSARSLQLANGDTVKVKAIGDGTNYTDSDFSATVTYTDTKPTPHTHTDANSDGKCDVCGESVMKELSFYAINDLHGKFKDSDSQPGVDELTTYIKDLYKDGAREEVLLSSGDMWQGTVESSTNKGELMTEWMNDLGFVSMTLGNHEYDWGPQKLLPNSELADFPFLAINVRYNNKPVDYCRPSVTVEKGGVKIGIIGAIGNCLSSISGEFSEGLRFITGSELTSLVKTEANRLRTDEGCDFIVYSIHDGSEGSSTGITDVSSLDHYDTSLSDGYVDLVFEAHTHQYYIQRDGYGVYHLQGGGENSYMSCAEVSYNTVTGSYTVTPKLISSSVYAKSTIKDDPIVETLFKKYFPDSDPYTTVLGSNASKKDGNDIVGAVAQLYYEKGVQQWGSSYTIALGGGYLKTRSPYSVARGNVTYASLFSVLPFDNHIVLGRIRGDYLLSKFLNNSSYTVYANISASEVSSSQYYYIIVDTYTSTYRPNNITEVARITEDVYARDLLADYISSGGWR